MARKTEAEKQAKREEQKRIVGIFKEMPIEKWADYISSTAENEKQSRFYRACAKKALSLENMMEYISTKDNTKASKKKFAESTWGIQYKKHDEPTKNGKVKKVFDKGPDGKPVVLLDDKGEPVKKQSLVYAVDYFCATYLDGLLQFEEEASTPAFDALKDWL